MKHCINCGKELKDEDAFCTSCGYKQPEQPVQPEEPIQQPVQPEQPVQPVEPVNPFGQPLQPVEPVNPFGQPEQPEKPVQPMEQPYMQAGQNTSMDMNQAQMQQMYPNMMYQQQYTGQKPPKQKKVKDPNKKSHKKLIIFSSIGAVLVIAAIVLAILTFPLKLEIEADSFTTHEISFSKTITIKSNQAVKSVKYAINPSDPDEKDEYKGVSDVSGTFTVDVELKDISLQPGEGRIYFMVDTMFGCDTVYIEYDYDLGFYSQIDPSKIIEKNGLSIAGNRLIVTVDKLVGQEQNLKKFFEEYDAIIVGMNYFTKQVQIEFDTGVIDDIFYNLKEQDKVEDVNYEYVFKTDLEPIEGYEDMEAEDDNREVATPEMPEEPEEQPETTTIAPTEPVTEETESSEVETSSEAETSSETEITSEAETESSEEGEPATSEEESTSQEEPTSAEETEPTTSEEESTSAEETEPTTLEEETTEAEEEEIEDPYAGYTYSWNLDAINAPAVWKYTKNSVPVKIGVMDSFIDFKHSDLNVSKNNVMLMDNEAPDEFYATFEKGYENHYHSGNNCSFCSFMNHGTHVSGTIASLINNGNASNGVCNNAELFFANEWKCEYDDYDGFSYYNTSYSFACDMTALVLSGVKVINYSVGASTYDESINIDDYAVNYMDNVFASLVNAGYDFVFVKAAGNDGMDAREDILVTFLKAGAVSSKHTLVVGSIQDNIVPVGAEGEMCYTFSSFSNYGELVDVVAPGSYIYNTYSRDNYGYMSGTSMAAPHVTGVVGLIYDANPDLTSEQVIDLVKNYASTYAVKNGTLYPVVDAELCVLEARKMKADSTVEEQTVSNKGIVSGTVVNAENSENISHATLIFKSEEGSAFYANSDDNGYYETMLPVGKYSLQVASATFVSETLYGVEVTEGATTYNPTVNMVEDTGMNGTVQGTLVNAFDASGVGGATLKFRLGFNNKTGNVVYTCEVDENGDFEVELEPGNYTVEAVMDGYASSYFTINVIGGRTVYNQNGTVTPVLAEGEMRIVLTWGDSPSDLDSHLTGYTPSGYQYHIMYNDKSCYEGDALVANLDVDDRSSYGPETTSVYVPASGEYVFYVHDFTNRYSSGSSAMGQSGAKVTLYIGNQSYEYNVPNKEGTIWKVFSINDGKINIINEMYFGETVE